ncbi:MAG: helix-turn-helix domain-containing protein [Solirubrobacterales bacterium]
MADKLKRGSRTDFIDPALVAAITHPVRANCVIALFERVASPSELAEELDLPVQNVAYHIRELERLGCIELVRVERKRSTEHFYRVTKRYLLDSDTWSRVGPKERATITVNLLRMIGGDVNEAMAHGTIDDDDNHISRSPMVVDREGWDEVVEELKETLDRVLEIQVRSAERRANGDCDSKDSIPIKVEILHFRSPPRSRRGT